jgi:transposase
VEKHKRRFDTTTGQLRELALWLAGFQVTHIALEATGVYWKPVWNALEHDFQLLLVNPQHLKSIPGKKTDFKDGERIADLQQHGLLRGSLVPTREMRELRDLTRMRARLAQERSSVINRIEKTLEDPNLKLGVVASDVVGVSGRAMLEAIIGGETDPAKLAELAKGTLRRKIPQLTLALEGNVTPHHRFLLRQWLDMLDFVDRKIALLDAQIAEHSRPFEPVVRVWMEIPGLRRTNAYALLAEIGADMTRFPTAAHLASWAAVCPGNHESAGRSSSGRTRAGNPWLRRTLCEAAWAASRTKHSYFRALDHRLARTRGRTRALLAVAHSLLVTVYTCTRDGEPYRDLGLDYFDRLNRRHLERSLVKRLGKLGHRVILEPAA